MSAAVFFRGQQQWLAHAATVATANEVFVCAARQMVFACACLLARPRPGRNTFLLAVEWNGDYACSVLFCTTARLAELDVAPRMFARSQLQQHPGSCPHPFLTPPMPPPLSPHSCWPTAAIRWLLGWHRKFVVGWMHRLGLGLSRDLRKEIPFATVVTDLGSAHPTWFDPRVRDADFCSLLLFCGCCLLMPKLKKFVDVLPTRVRTVYREKPRQFHDMKLV